MRKTNLICLLLLLVSSASGQSSPVRDIFPQGTQFYSNIRYADDTVQKHLLDIYLPAHSKGKAALIVWIHGGAWMLNDKYADMNYMKHTVGGFLDSGYALASIDYRYSTSAVFPAQIQDCNQALEFLFDHAEQYHFDRSRIALIGFSAGGHLASLLGLSHNNDVQEFYPRGFKTRFSLRCILDYYGPSDLVAIDSSPDTSVNNSRHPVALLLGALPVDRPDLARKASPVSYVDPSDPPFLIVQGEKDESVPNTQSRLLHAWLEHAGIKNELILVPGAPHYGPMFDADWIRTKVFHFLHENMGERKVNSQ